MWSRRELVFFTAAGALAADGGSQVAITIDDFAWRSIPERWRTMASDQFLQTLDRYKVRAAAFVAGHNVDDSEGLRLIKAWSDRGHFIANHTYSHRWIDANGLTLEAFSEDMLRNEAILRDLPGFRKLFRFPMLKEGRTAEKRDGMRAFLAAQGYRNGHVTIDASDWYYDSRLREQLARNPDFDFRKYREPYLAHIAGRARCYDGLALAVLGRSIPHTLLIHFNLINVLFLDDLLKHLSRHGWQLIDAATAFADPVFARQPMILPAGESLIWALAKESGKTGLQLRYPGEDGDYEKPILDRLGI